jgi:ubiquinol-cytochrome c reductase cytochrome b subunit
MNHLADWFDHRTGYRRLVHDALYEHIPGGARWRYTWGSTLVFCFVTQIVTGVILWAAYSPSTQSAWESVYYIQHQMTAGWLLRGVHHFMAYAMVALLALHFLQVVIDGAYRAPREINFWVGLILMQIVFAMALTGYLLPWDQKGYWATKVATSMISLVPGIGPTLERLVVGGSEYGHHTLTRFFALHAGVLPGLLLLFLAMHLALFRRHGLKAREPFRQPDCTFWPDQILRDAAMCLAVLCVVLVLVLHNYVGVEAGQPLSQQLGAPLGAPADPAESYSAARPEAYFLFLFQTLKYLEAYPPVVGAVIVPGLVVLSLFLLPFIGRWQLGHRFNVAWSVALFFAACVLTGISYYADHNGRTPESQHYLAAVAAAEADAARAVELAGSPQGIPPTGALALMSQDAKSQGPKLFRQHCAACHSHFDPAGGGAADQRIVNDAPTAANLWRFGSREWLAGLLNPESITGPHYFGQTKFAEGEMVGFVKESIATPLESLDGDELAAFRRKIEDAIYTVSAEAQLPYQQAADDAEAASERITRGRDVVINDLACTGCHKFHDEGALGSAPDLTGYASREWLRSFISDPAHERFYRDTNDRMPAFAPEREDAAAPARLTPEQLDLIVSWLRHEWYEPASK